MSCKRSIKVPQNIEELVKCLHEIFEDDQINVEEVHELMSSYVSKEDDWRKYANYDPYRYTRNLVDEGNGKFNLIVLCWGEGQGRQPKKSYLVEIDTIGLHRMENTSHSDTACTLHLYCPPFDMCNSFDQRTGHRQTCKVTFWSKYGTRTPFVSTV
ncbi:hypothetical protein QZH41_011649 [Actinostola sp. cb2023]|nr:hypothetical protein QZH41_011649 [Actinostola sp. cb2023]